MNRPLLSASLLLCFSASCLAAEEALQQAQDEYDHVFRSPTEIFFEIQPDRKGFDLSLHLKTICDRLRLFPQVEEVFPMQPDPFLEREKLVVFSLLNSQPVEFAAWLEKFRPAQIRRGFKGFKACQQKKLRDAQAQKGPNACVEKPNTYDLLGLACGETASSTVPFFKQPIRAGIYLRLRDKPGQIDDSLWEQQGLSIEREIGRYFTTAEAGDIRILRRQYVENLSPNPRLLIAGFWIAAASAGAVLFVLLFREITPYLILLAVLAILQLILYQAAVFFPGLIDLHLLPAASGIALFWGILSYAKARSGKPGPGGESRMATWWQRGSENFCNVLKSKRETEGGA